jgi:hypothetical protein
MSVPTATALLTHAVRFLLAAIGCLLMFVISVQGFGNAYRNLNDLQSVAQYLMTYSQFLYSALGPCVIVLRFTSLRWFHMAWRAWAFFFTMAVALIPWAWIQPSILQTIGFAAVGVACAGFICFLVLRGARPNSLRSVVSDA